MATMTNGSQEHIHPSGQGNNKHPSTLQAVSWAVWETVWNKTFVLGTLVGVALMYVGSRTAQAYLSTDQDTDHPF